MTMGPAAPAEDTSALLVILDACLPIVADLAGLVGGLVLAPRVLPNRAPRPSRAQPPAPNLARSHKSSLLRRWRAPWTSASPLPRRGAPARAWRRRSAPPAWLAVEQWGTRALAARLPSGLLGSCPPPPSPVPRAGEVRTDEIDLLERLGGGAVAVKYTVADAADGDGLARAVREVLISKRLTHPNVVGAADISSAARTPSDPHNIEPDDPSTPGAVVSAVLCVDGAIRAARGGVDAAATPPPVSGKLTSVKKAQPKSATAAAVRTTTPARGRIWAYAGPITTSGTRLTSVSHPATGRETNGPGAAQSRRRWDARTCTVPADG
jgi:hypothetical protein